jgi:CDP-glycerol glycerophosphotransferase (TagB/SpsB family)
MLKNEYIGYILFAFFMGILAYTMIPYDTFDLTRHYEFIKQISKQDIGNIASSIRIDYYFLGYFSWIIHQVGLPKSDMVEGKKDINWVTIFNLDIKPKRVIVYTPTFRDIYIHKKLDDVDDYGQTIFGYLNEKEELEEFLVENNILLIIKLHKSFPFYRELEKLHIKEDKSYFKNCYFLDFELEAKYDLSIYNLFEQSDAMIADYSSISFDYLPYDKHIIYNIPDIEEYRKYRGFSYEPIEEMMAGERVKSIDQLKAALLNVLKGKDRFPAERKRVISVVNEVPQGKALENIYKFIEGLIE